MVSNEGPRHATGGVGHDGAAGELFVKGGTGESPGIQLSIFEGHHGASGIQKMRPTESEPRDLEIFAVSSRSVVKRDS
jgi:hypothetical protein